MRLTNAIRDAVVLNAVKKSGLPAKRASLLGELNAWLEALRTREVEGKEGEQRIERAYKAAKIRMSALPAWAHKDLSRPISKGVYVRFLDGREVEHRYLTASALGTDPQRNREYDTHENRITPQYVHTTAKEDKEHARITRELEANKEQRGVLSAEVRGTLESITTIEKLVKVWPEAVALLPLDAPKPVTSLAIATDHLNAKIGLP